METEWFLHVKGPHNASELIHSLQYTAKIIFLHFRQTNCPLVKDLTLKSIEKHTNTNENYVTDYEDLN